MLIPSLGAIAYLGRNEPISEVKFFVEPHKEEIVPDLEVRNPFRGKLGDKISFEKSVRRKDVEAVFGKIDRGTTNSAAVLGLLKAREPFWRKLGEEVEERYYPARGVSFVITSNIVTSFTIFKPQPELK